MWGRLFFFFFGRWGVHGNGVRLFLYEPSKKRVERFFFSFSLPEALSDQGLVGAVDDDFIVKSLQK